MFAILLVVHIIICIALIGSILIQPSEGGGALGIGGGPSGLMSSRSAANFMTRTTGVLAGLFFLTSIGLTVFSGHSSGASSVMGGSKDDLPTTSIDLSGKPANAAANAATNATGIPASEAAPQKSNPFETSTATNAANAASEKTDNAAAIATNATSDAKEAKSQKK